MLHRTRGHVTFAIVAIIVVVIAIAYLFSHPRVSIAPQSPTVTATFYCAQRTIIATFATSSVRLDISGGRSLTLPQTISGSGARYEATSTGSDIVFWNKGDNAFLTEDGEMTSGYCTAAHITTLPGITNVRAYSDQSRTFVFDMPRDHFFIVGSAPGYTQDWSALATMSGMILAHIEVPQSYEPGTNFGDAKFIVSASADPSAVATCLMNSFNQEIASTTQVMIGSVPFTKITFTDAAAGNRYETTSYRTVRDGECYAIEYTIHYGVFENYPPGAVQKFDEEKIHSALENMAQSFRFLK